MKHLYVTWRNSSGGLSHSEIIIEGKVNHLTVEKATRQDLSFYERDNLRDIVAWSEEEPFTYEEENEFWTNDDY